MYPYNNIILYVTLQPRIATYLLGYINQVAIFIPNPTQLENRWLAIPSKRTGIENRVVKLI